MSLSTWYRNTYITNGAYLNLDNTGYIAINSNPYFRTTGATGGLYAGENAGNTGITGLDNVCLGKNAGNALTTGAGCTFVGSRAGDVNTIGIYNTFVGTDAGGANISSVNCTFIGYSSGKVNTTNDNTFVGYNCGVKNTGGVNNTFMGSEAGAENVSGTQCTFMGYRAGYANTTSSNTFVGFQAGGSNTTGFENTCMGVSAGVLNTVGGYNAYFGFEAGKNATSNYNSLFGFSSGVSITGGAYNTLVGGNSGTGLQTGNYNTCLGYGTCSTNYSGGIALGVNSSGTSAKVALSNGFYLPVGIANMPDTSTDATLLTYSTSTGQVAPSAIYTTIAGTIIGTCFYNPNPAVTKSMTETAWTSDAKNAPDSTNIKITFKAPPSGNAIIYWELTGYEDANGYPMFWATRCNSTTFVPTWITRGNSAINLNRYSCHHNLTGLTVGTSYDAILWVKVGASGSGILYYGTDANEYGPAVGIAYAM